jgi:hypothetical protein
MALPAIAYTDDFRPAATYHGEFRPSPEFPETWFYPADSVRSTYRERVHRGRDRMRTRRVVLAGLARNIAHLATTVCRRLEKTGRLFRDYRVVLFENDSHDETPRVLHDWSRTNPRVQLLHEDFDDPVHPQARCLHRVQRMAYYRNQYHRHIAEHYGDFDDAIIVDTDLAGGWSYDGLANTFGYHAAWDVVGSNGIIYKRNKWHWNQYLQYDAWAFRRHGSDVPLTTREVNQMAWRRGEPLLRVSSCFGGMAVYRMEAFLAGQYTGEDCEHVTFHRSLREWGFDRCFLNPSQIVVYGRHRRTNDSAMRIAFRVLHRCGLTTTPYPVYEQP